MIWPERPTVHDKDPYDVLDAIVNGPSKTAWGPPKPLVEPHGMPFRRCTFCGGIHPEDLLRFLEMGADMGGSDWKYGFPHKFYVEGIPNPRSGDTVQIGTQSSMSVTTPLMGVASEFTTAKWYSDHLLDKGYDDEALDTLLKKLTEFTGIEWFLKDGRVAYVAPYKGFQKIVDREKLGSEQVKK